MKTRKIYLTPEIGQKSLLIENALMTLSNEQTNGAAPDIQNGQYNGENNYSPGDGSDAGAKGGLSDWDNL